MTAPAATMMASGTSRELDQRPSVSGNGSWPSRGSTGPDRGVDRARQARLTGWPVSAER